MVSGARMDALSCFVCVVRESNLFIVCQRKEGELFCLVVTIFRSGARERCEKLSITRFTSSRLTMISWSLRCLRYVPQSDMNRLDEAHHCLYHCGPSEDQRFLRSCWNS